MAPQVGSRRGGTCWPRRLTAYVGQGSAGSRPSCIGSEGSCSARPARRASRRRIATSAPSPWRARGCHFWELRAATSLARLWAEHGRRTEARNLLASLYGWFSEGFDTPDLVEAKALLETLADPRRLSAAPRAWKRLRSSRGSIPRTPTILPSAASIVDAAAGSRGFFRAGSKVVYPHLGGVPAINGYSYTFRNG